MESILKKVNELEGLLLKALVESEKVAGENEANAKVNKELRTSLNKKASELKAREEAIKPIEDVAVFKAKADATMRDANKKMKSAGAEQDEADKRKADNAKEHAGQKARIAREDERILDEKKGLEKGYAQLRAAEAKSETEVLKKIVKKTLK